MSQSETEPILTSREPLVGDGGTGFVDGRPGPDPAVAPTAVAVASVLVAGLVACNLLSTIVGEQLVATHSSQPVAPLFLIYHNVSYDACAFAVLWLLRTHGAGGIGTPGGGASVLDCGDPVEPLRPGSGSPGRYRPKHVAWCGVQLCAVYQLGNWLYFVGLANMSVTASLIFYQSSSAWVLLLSVLLLPGEVFQWRKAAAVLVCLLGVTLVALDGWDNSHNAAVSMAAMLVSTILWALYEVLLKRWLGKANTADALLFVGVRGLANAVFFWPVLFIASAAGGDPFPKPGEHYAWGGLVLMAGISVVLTLFITLGIAWTSPLFVRVGSTLTVPASIVLVDIAWRGQPGSWSRLVGAAYVVAGFALLGLPNRAPDKRSPAFRVVSDTGLVAAIAGGALTIGICAWDK